MGVFDTAIKRAAEAIVDNGAAFIVGTNRILPLAYMYKVAVTSMTDGYVGIPRMSLRRVPFVASDILGDAVGNDAISSGTDIIVNTSDSISGAATPTTAWFTGTDAGFTAAARYLYIPVAPTWGSVHVGIFDNLDASVVYTLYGLTSSSNDTIALSGTPIKLDEVTLGASSGTQQSVTFGMLPIGLAGAGDTPGTTGGGYYRFVPAISLGWRYLGLKIAPATDPTSGGLRIRVYRSSL